MNFFRLFSKNLERFCDFGLSILIEYYSFLSHRITNETGHQIGVMVLTNHRTDVLDYSNITYIFSSSADITNDLLIDRQDVIGSNRSNSTQCSESKIPVDRNSRTV